jgi:hypothetical protein
VPRLLGGVRRDPQQDVVRRLEVGDGQVPRGRVRKLPRETGVPAEDGQNHGMQEDRLICIGVNYSENPGHIS